MGELYRLSPGLIDQELVSKAQRTLIVSQQRAIYAAAVREQAVLLCVAKKPASETVYSYLIA